MLEDLNRLDLSYENASFLKKAGFENEEYISFSNFKDDCREKLIWDQETRWAYAYWVNGRSEGYYVHMGKIMVEELLISNDGITAKFWNRKKAE